MKLVPLFPLQIVVFPYEELNLHIFEPRYRELIKDCEADDVVFGIPYYEEDVIMKYGTFVRLKEVAQVYEDGRMDIKTVGLRPFEIKRYAKIYPGKTYPGGYVTELFWEKEGDIRKTKEIRDKLRVLYEYMNIQKWPAELDGDFITFEVAHKVGLSREQEHALLQIVSEVDRQLYILDHLNKMIPMVREAEQMRKKVQMNGYFKNLIPPEI